MKFEPATHPEHGTEPVGTLERLSGVARLQRTGDGWEYTGDTEVSWDSQVTEPPDDRHHMILVDAQGREWLARFTE